MGGGLLFCVLLMWAWWTAPTRALAAHLGLPVPAGVRVTLYETRDWLGIAPEPVVYLAFSAREDEVNRLIIRTDIQPVGPDSYVPAAGPAAGWLPAEQVGPNGRVYRREHLPRKGARWPVGRNRSWTEYLWIDGTGTNAYFLLWGV
jgi:hypothetical protein